MLTGVPYSVLVTDDFTPTAGDRTLFAGSTSLQAKTGNLSLELA